MSGTTAKSGSYSFSDVNATITGVGGSFSIGQGAGAAEEGIEFEFEEDADTMDGGADGTSQHTLNPTTRGTCTVRLLKTSSTNQLLSNMYDAQHSSSATWGANVITCTNRASGDKAAATAVAFKKKPNFRNPKLASNAMVEWVFNCGYINVKLGSFV